MSSNHKSIAALLLIRFALTIVLVWAMTTYLDAYFYVGGSWRGFVVVAALLTLLNFLLRPVLRVILLPLHFFATFLAVILANALFLWITQMIALRFDPAIVTLDIRGWTGWMVAGVIFGLSNWIFTH